MKPVEFDGFNTVYGKGQEEYIPLPAHRTEDGTVTTEWEFTPEERAAIANGANLRISQLTFNKALQPIRPYIIR